MATLIVFLNKIFRKPRVRGRESAEAYADWEYEMGRVLVHEYLEPRGDLRGKIVLDIGCGLGGKTVAYGEVGASAVFGADLSVDNVVASAAYAGNASLGSRWAFLVSDVAQLPMADQTFDIVIANDAMEHFADPEVAVMEMARVTKGNGVIWLFFTPHFSPLGSHLYDYIYTPWCHLIFRRRHLRGAIGKVLRERNPDAPVEEIDQELGRIMDSFDRELNHMSIRRFFRILKRYPELRQSFTEFTPAKYRALKVMTRIPFARELFTGSVVCRLERVG